MCAAILLPAGCSNSAGAMCWPCTCCREQSVGVGMHEIFDQAALSDGEHAVCSACACTTATSQADSNHAFPIVMSWM